jgi:hypothetical protein
VGGWEGEGVLGTWPVLAGEPHKVTGGESSSNYGPPLQQDSMKQKGPDVASSRSRKGCTLHTTHVQ